MKIAAIDIGTNSIHMVVVRLDRGGAYEVVDREKEMVKLGQGSLGAGRLTETAVENGLACLNRLRKLCRAHECDYVVASATSVVREAENSDEFLAAIEAATGLKVRVLQGTEEAELIFRGVRDEMDLSDRKALVLDLGGGSTEVVVGNAFGTHLCVSLPIGIIRMTEEFAANPGVTPNRNYKALVKRVRELAGDVMNNARSFGFDVLVGTSGTFKSLGELIQPLADIPFDVTHLGGFTVEQLAELTTELQSMSEDARAAMKRMNPKRAPNIAVGATIILELMRLAGARRVQLTNRALRDGLVLEAIRTLPGVDWPDCQGRDLRRRSVLALARNHPSSLAHGQHVADLALQLFDQTGGLHGLGPEDRELLHHAGVLHDIGLDVAYTRHHKHSYYLITNAELPGFDADEILEVALIARYHRKSFPGTDQEEFRTLRKSRRKAVTALGALLRIADGLDRTHRGIVERIRVRHEADRVVLELEAREDTELERYAAAQKTDLFDRLFGRAVVMEDVPAGPAPPSLLELSEVRE